MKEIATLTLIACALLPSGELAAQTYKCVDKAGKITYTGKLCSDLGLKDAGEVKDRLNINPAYQPSSGQGERPRPPSARGEGAPRRSAPPPAPPPAAEARTAEPPAAAEDSAAPDRRCFSVKTAKGNVTRCNDTPPE